MKKYTYIKQWVIFATLPMLFLVFLFYYISNENYVFLLLSLFTFISLICIWYKAIFVKVIFFENKIIYKSLFIKKEIENTEIFDIIIIRKRRRDSNEFIKYSPDFILEFGVSHYLLIRKNNNFPSYFYNIIKPVSNDYITVQFRENMKKHLNQIIK